MLGEGPLHGPVTALIARSGLDPFVTVTFNADAPRLLQTAAIYVSLQTGDNYGSQALLEAMGAGCAVVASDVGQTDRLITRVVGERVALTPEAVADGIERLLDDPDGTRRRGECASQLARTRYSADAYAEFVESLYERAVRRHRAATVHLS
jgi:glycosyltransferase involved in cell wall biosynthesis